VTALVLLVSRRRSVEHAAVEVLGDRDLLDVRLDRVASG
jgi:hypothetical protein